MDTHGASMNLFVLCCSIPPYDDEPNPKFHTLQFLVRSASLSDAEDAARRAIREGGRRLKLRSWEEVFLDDAFEIEEVPAEGVLLNWIQADITKAANFGTVTVTVHDSVRGIHHHRGHPENSEVAPSPLIVIGEEKASQ